MFYFLNRNNNLWNTENIKEIYEENKIIDSQEWDFVLKNGFYSKKEFLLLENYIILKNNDCVKSYLKLDFISFDYCKSKLKLLFFLNSNSIELKFDDYKIYKKWKKVCIKKTIQNNFHNKFKIKSKIYENKNSVVFKVRNKKNKTFILKKLVKNEFSINEIKILRSINHKNVIKIKYLYESKNSFYIIMKYCNYKSLENCLNKINSKELKLSIVKQILSGISYIHSKSIIHRDIKPSNIFLHKNKKNIIIVKIGDFGISNFIENNITNIYGSPGYIAPELLKKDIDNSNNSYKIDIYSLGHVIYNIVTRKFIFNYNNENQILYLNKKNQYLINYISNDNLIQIIKMCLDKDPNQRTSIKQLQLYFNRLKSI